MPMDNKRKKIIFERMNLFNLVLAVVYYKIGFDVMYFTIDKKIEGSRYFERAREIFSINRIPEKHFSFNIERSANSYVFNSVDSIYSSFFAKNRSIKIITALFKSDLVQSVYKKIVSEKLLSFYRIQLVLNMIVKDAALAQLHYIPSEFVYCINLTKSYPLLHILDKKIKIPKYSFIINLFSLLFEKNVQIFLLAVWPFILIKNVKKITLYKTSPTASYSTAIRIYKAGFNFKSECRTIDFLLDGKNITKDNTLFCIDTELDKDFRDELVRRKYNFVDIPNILRELNWYFIKRIYFGLLLPLWLKLCIVSILEPPFIVYSYRNILGLYLRWSFFLDKYTIKNFVVYNDCNISHIIRNMLLSQKDVKTWYYIHSCHTDDLFIAPQANKDIRSVYFSYLYYDNLVAWGKKSSSYYMQQHNNISNFVNIGCLWSEHIKKIAEENNCSRTLNQIHAKYKQNGTNIKKIIGIFDTSFGKKTSETPLTAYAMKCFLKGFLRLAEEKDDVVFVVKLKKRLRYIKEDIGESFPYYEKMKRNSKFYFLEDLHDPSVVNAVCDLNISACFTSTLNESLGYRKKAIYFDAVNNFRGCYYDCFPNLVAHTYDELIKLVDYWLYEVTDKEFSDYIDKYIKAEIDPYADGKATTRFRELLIK